MARTQRLKKSGGISRYHLMSRTNDKRFLFEKGFVKSGLIAALKRAAVFSGIPLNAYTSLDNHFHVVCTVTVPDEPVPPEELLRRYRTLYGNMKADDLANRWSELEAAGFTAQLEEEYNRLRRRMNDISEFIKTFKEVFNRWYKRHHPYTGSLWAGRFKSTLIEDGVYFARCKRYVQLNAVRAGIVTQIKDYRWVWCEDDEISEISKGSVPGLAPGLAAGCDCEMGGGAGVFNETELMRRVPQIGAGKVFGSFAFVMETLFALGDRIAARHIAPHAAGTMGFSSHGWRLAKLQRSIDLVAG